MSRVGTFIVGVLVIVAMCVITAFIATVAPYIAAVIVLVALGLVTRFWKTDFKARQ